MTLEEILQSGKPYFGEFLISEQGPYEKYLPHFRNLVNSLTLNLPDTLKSSPVTILEVGSWAGASLACWDEASGGQAQFIAIDQWKPYFNNPASLTHHLMDEAARSGQIERLFWHNMKVLGIDKRLTVIKEDSKSLVNPNVTNAINLRSDGVDIAFIDGDHRYEQAKLDILNAMPLVREGGILCGDDLQLQYHEVQDHTHHMAMLREGLSDAHDAGRSYHPGVTQAVAECFGDRVSTADRLWAVQKVNGAWNRVEF